MGIYQEDKIALSCVLIRLIGRSADEVGRMKDSDNAQFQKVFEDATFKWYVLRLRVKMEMYNVSPHI